MTEKPSLPPTGPVVGRPKSATFRTMDIAGIDILAHVAGNLSARLDTADEVLDQAVSVTPDELTELIQVARRAYGTLGRGAKQCQSVERDNLVASRRGLRAARDLQVGERLTDEALIALRPAVGIDAARWDTVVSRRVATAIASGAPIREEDLVAETSVRRRDIA